ncbi:MerR family transcriptional regulator [Actinotalea sp. M2MS4P-6]|uniref:MerR family transcriptional regulator n=1 Tax=Actinotalea sp. M2MS4P-6 TaxID=2983762 RepID=UPI0021E3D20F|nr:MerR family transcriptional regulator [Actinotalea sp. M2MS4P-6]MCV2393154.1 MerR family transcriptional regulator [Actinotalea sp. M2MS4P-6]
MAPDRLLTIGEFSRLTRISIRMLRHYDEHGVLAPSQVDEWSGYRYYSRELLAVAGRVRELRDLGLGVDELAHAARLDGPTLAEVVRRHRERLVSEASAAAVRLHTADRLIARLEEHDMSTVPVTRTTIPARTVASVRGTIPTYADERLLWERLAGMQEAGAQPAPDALSVAVFHDDGYVDENPDVEVQLTVTAPFADTGDVRCREVPATDVALATLHGSYDGISEVMTALGSWIAEQGLRICGPMFDVYRVSPASGLPPEQWVTDVCVPVADSGTATGTTVGAG